MSIRPEVRDMIVKKSYDITCRSSGSRPPPVITWYIDNNRIGR